ncbi:MAG: NAD(P)/FAD-dependent oxidoreductase [Bacteroidales bacterium]
MKAGIVGGGMLGLYLAHRLRQAGWEVTLLEGAPEPGGLASAWQIGPYTWDKYYHVISLSDTILRSFLSETGLDKTIVWKETRTGFYTDGRLYSMSNTREFLAFPPLSLPDKLRLGGTIFLGSLIRSPRRLEKMHVSDWLIRWSGKRTFSKIWLPLLKAKLGDAWKKTSAAFIWATIRRMYAARRSGEKKEMFGYVKGGYSTILSTVISLLRENGVDIRTGFTVARIQKKGDKTEITGENRETLAFDRVILTVPPPVILKILPDVDPVEKEKMSAIPYLGVICVSLLLRRHLSPFYVTNVTEEGIPITGIIEMTALVDQETFGSNALVYLPRYLEPNDPLFDRSDEEIIRLFTNALRKVHPVLTEEEVVTAKVARSRYVFALPVLNYSRIKPSFETGIDGIYMVNSAHITNSTLNVNETLTLANEFLNKMFHL